MTAILSPTQVTGDLVKMARTNPMHFDASGKISPLDTISKGDSFAQAMVKALNGDTASAVSSISGAASAVSSVSGAGAVQSPDFTSQMLKGIDEVSGYQQESDLLTQQMIVDPNSVDAHDVTIAMAKANLSLNLARAVINRVTQAYRDVINSR
jgi:flagellar hook-basal body complex protein FliE